MVRIEEKDCEFWHIGDHRCLQTQNIRKYHHAIESYCFSFISCIIYFHSFVLGGAPFIIISKSLNFFAFFQLLVNYFNWNIEKKREPNIFNLMCLKIRHRAFLLLFRDFFIFSSIGYNFIHWTVKFRRVTPHKYRNFLLQREKNTQLITFYLKTVKFSLSTPSVWLYIIKYSSNFHLQKSPLLSITRTELTGDVLQKIGSIDIRLLRCTQSHLTRENWAIMFVCRQTIKKWK